MKICEFLSIFFFALSCSCGEDSYAFAIFFVMLSGVCARLAYELSEIGVGK